MSLLRDLIKLGLAGTNPSGVATSMETCTWAQRPDAAARAGRMIFVTDVGVAGSIFVSNGTTWAPTGAVVLFSGVNVFTAAPSTTEQIATQVALPAGLIRPNSNLKIFISSEKSGSVDAANTDLRIRIGSSGSTSDAAAYGGIYMAQTALGMGVISLIGRVSATELRKLGRDGISSSSPFIGSSAITVASAVTVPNLDTTDNILSLTVKPGGTTDITSINGLTIELVG